MRALASVLMWGKGRDEHTARWRRNTYKMKDELLIMYRNEAYKQHKISRLYEIHVCVCVRLCAGKQVWCTYFKKECSKLNGEKSRSGTRLVVCNQADVR